MIPRLKPGQHFPLLVGGAKGHGLGHAERHVTAAHGLLGLVAQGGDGQPPLDGGFRHARLGSNVCQLRAVGHHAGEGFGFVHGGKLDALHILDGGETQRVVGADLRPDFDGHRMVGLDVALFGQQGEGAIAPLPANDFKLSAFLTHHEILQQPVRLDGLGQSFKGGRVDGPARVDGGRGDFIQRDGLDGHWLVSFCWTWVGCWLCGQ